MAMLTTLQCYVPTTRMPVGSTRSYSYARTAVPTLPSRRRSMRVRCQGEGDDPSPLTPEQQPKQPTPAAPAAPKPAAAKKESASFSDVLAFSGPAPERINGRLAMVGFVAAMAVEAARGDSLLAQVGNGGLPWFLGTAALLSAASLVPMFKGVTAQSRSGGLMTADAELWNGRFAMLGLVALAFTEYLKGGPLV